MEESKRTTIMLPIALKREARAKAIREGRNLSAVLRELLTAYVKGEWQPAKEPEP